MILLETAVTWPDVAMTIVVLAFFGFIIWVGLK